MAEQTLKPKRMLSFSPEMVNAVRDGTKGTTRRLIRPQPPSLDSLWPDENSHIEWSDMVKDTDYYVGCGWSPYKSGDVVQVRETWGGVFYDGQYILQYGLKPKVVILVDVVSHCPYHGRVYLSRLFVS